jgi:hypothetical protein
MIEKHWDKILTVICLILTGVVEAFNQAVAGSSTVAAAVPSALASTTMHYVPLVLLIVAGVIWLVGRTRHKPSQPQEQSQEKSIHTTTSGFIAAPAFFDFNPTEYFRTAYYSQTTENTERNMRASAAKYASNDREGFFAKFIGVGLIAYIYDIVWAYIFRSQILMLAELNRRNGRMSVADAKTFYDHAAVENPNTYANYSLDQWLNFMTTNTLVIRHPSEMLEITLGGKDFLKYITHWGRQATDRYN